MRTLPYLIIACGLGFALAHRAPVVDKPTWKECQILDVICKLETAPFFVGPPREECLTRLEEE